MKCRALETIQRHHLLTPGAAVIVAVSGERIRWRCSFFFLNEIREEFHLTLSAAHINHGLRGAEETGMNC